MSDGAPAVTVIVPTYRDWRRLERCLDALERQSVSPERFEVLVVNNDPSDRPPPAFRLPKRWRLMDCARTGSYAARNEGLRHARGHIIAFTDSDCVPEPDWLANALARFSGERPPDRVAGHIELFYARRRPNAIELYESYFAFRQRENAAKGTSVTANLFVRASVFEAVGAFDERLLSGGDHEWGYRASAAGYSIEYAADVVVRHPARGSVRALVGKSRRVEAGKYNRRARGVELFRFVHQLRPPVRKFRSFRRRSRAARSIALKVIAVHYLVSLARAFERLRIAWCPGASGTIRR